MFTRSAVKLACETGLIETENHSNGIIYKFYLKYSAEKKLAHSLFKLKAGLMPEYIELSNALNGFRFSIKGDYTFYIKNNPLQLALAAKNNMHFFKEGDQQLFQELNGTVNYDVKMGSRHYLRLNNDLLIRSINTNKNYALYKDNFVALWAYKNGPDSEIRIGAYTEYDQFLPNGNNSDTQYRYGPQLEFSYTKKAILNAQYRFGIHSGNNVHDHRFTLLMGKYISQNVSFFLFYYFIRQDENVKSDTNIFSQLESFNNFSLKLGIDISKPSQLYFKILSEAQEIYQGSHPLYFWQGVVGFQLRL